jgi:ubiquinone/menaquinone biosynthesis C-methylase UbiE
MMNLRNWFVRKEIRKQLRKLKPNDNYLDLGCGEGMHLLPFAIKYENLSFIGFDRNPASIEVCEAYKKKFKLENLELKQLDFGKENSEAKAQLVVCCSALQYLQDDVFGLKNIYNSLAENGKVILYVPINGKVILKFYQKIKDKYSGYDKQQDIQHKYTSEEIEEKLTSSGFKIQKKEYVNGTLGIISYELYYILLTLITQTNFVFGFLLSLIFIGFLPVILFLKLIDFFVKYREGNGLMVVAGK